MQRQAQFNFWYFVFALLAILWIQSLWVGAQRVERISYSEFQQHLKDGKIDSLAIYNNRIEGTFKEPMPSGEKRAVFLHQRFRVRGDVRRRRRRP